MRARSPFLVLAALIASCGSESDPEPPPRAKVSIASGEWTVRVDPDGREIALLRGDVVLARLPADGLSLGTREVVDDQTNYDPWPIYKPSGLQKRRVWERTWELQRREDAIDARVALAEGDPERLTDAEAKALKAGEVGDIPAPPRYTSADFVPGPAWRLRGKLDVPREVSSLSGSTI